MTNSRRKGESGERELATAVLDVLSVQFVRQLDQCREGGLDLAQLPNDDSPAAYALSGCAIECQRH